MPLPTPNLDDRDFDDLVRAARERILRSCPEWTDLSPSDPGMVLLDVFAYLTDQMLYRLNRLPGQGLRRLSEPDRRPHHPAGRGPRLPPLHPRGSRAAAAAHPARHPRQPGAPGSGGRAAGVPNRRQRHHPGRRAGGRRRRLPVRAGRGRARRLRHRHPRPVADGAASADRRAHRRRTRPARGRRGDCRRARRARAGHPVPGQSLPPLAGGAHLHAPRVKPRRIRRRSNGRPDHASRRRSGLASRTAR